MTTVTAVKEGSSQQKISSRQSAVRQEVVHGAT